jgi:hypothetical protein
MLRASVALPVYLLTNFVTFYLTSFVNRLSPPARVPARQVFPDEKAAIYA